MTPVRHHQFPHFLHWKNSIKTHEIYRVTSHEGHYEIQPFNEKAKGSEFDNEKKITKPVTLKDAFYRVAEAGELPNPSIASGVIDNLHNISLNSSEYYLKVADDDEILHGYVTRYYEE